MTCSFNVCPGGKTCEGCGHKMKVYSVAVRPTPEEVKAKGLYYDEAEHQDGYGYWKQFTDVDEALDDLIRYLENK